MRRKHNIGVYYYDDSKNKKHGEFDVVLQRKDGFEFYEVKYFKTPLKLSEMKREEEQIQDIQGLNISKIAFVSVNGFEKADAKYSCLCGSDIYFI